VAVVDPLEAMVVVDVNGEEAADPNGSHALLVGVRLDIRDCLIPGVEDVRGGP
jgi:hypothetical protein